MRLADGAQAVLCCPAEKLDAATIAALPDTVRVIGTFSVGYDHIDMPAARARGIAVVNTPDVLSVATAECALLLLLAAARRAGEGERLVRRGGWPAGRRRSCSARAWSGAARHLRHGPHRARTGQAGAGPGDGGALPRRRTACRAEMERGAVYHDDDDSFLAASELLSLNAPGGAETMHWLNAERIAKLPRGAVVANAGRGTLVDDAALIAALRTGQVAAAGARRVSRASRR